ncbi:hypothetical protein Pmani_038701 [Petrolisthes manimaculis]|uniref:Uncharacterized protein n=1 Tax=Petrolisthes manimaculis TaxID=1843537 RepID=A0AAE1TM16_9EUCA|nr:hypothetical protein Pmani_038701 [Petrolisthes manimaculis]
MTETETSRHTWGVTEKGRKVRGAGMNWLHGVGEQGLNVRKGVWTGRGEMMERGGGTLTEMKNRETEREGGGGEREKLSPV